MKVGNYVRYRCVYDNTIKIKKINAIVPPDNLIKENYYKFDDYEGTIEKCIIKSSPNIIDLIEVGDYVNGMEVTGIGGTRWDKNDLHCYCEHNGNENWKQVMIPAKDIKSIVTKEQFESMEYKVVE